jgi:hypothetical protein
MNLLIVEVATIVIGHPLLVRKLTFDLEVVDIQVKSNLFYL